MGSVRVADIVVPKKRMRKEVRDHTPLAKSMREVGLLHPIGLSTENILVYGLHRLKAAKSLGWEEIEAKFIQGDELDAQLAEIDENLQDNSLSVIEQSAHIARREQIMQARGERAKRGDNQHAANGGPVTVTGPSKTTKELASELGMSESSYQKRSKIGRGLTEETQAVIAGLDPHASDLPNSTRQLNYLSGVEDASNQVEMARRVAKGDAVDVWAAEKQLGQTDGQLQITTEEDSNSDTGPDTYQTAMRQGLKDEAERHRSEEPIFAVAIRRAATMEYVIEWSDGSANTVGRPALLKEHDYKKCKHCAGYGIVKKRED